MVRWQLLATAAFVTTLLFSSGLAAHPLAPLAVDIEERAGGELQVALKRPKVQPRGARFALAPPSGCRRRDASRWRVEDDAMIESFALRCDGSLAGKTVAVTGLVQNDAVVRLTLADGRELHRLLSETASRWRVPEQASAGRVVADYLKLGVEHMLGGLDHLLFVVGMLLLLRRVRPTVIALTGFTVGHSVTLCCATLGLVQLPQRPVEVAIALSLVLLALAIVQQRQPSPRSLWPMSVAVGLVHGLGFAAVLDTSGLRDGDLVWALGSFNLGLELAQLAVAAVGLGVLHLSRDRWPAAPRLLRIAPGYLMGGLATMWCFERALALVG
jgi:hydrogenase/urease accessory protein HupE